MKIGFSQVYIRAGVSFPFSHIYQAALAEAFTSTVGLSDKFLKKFGEDWTIIFFISAKRELDEAEVSGPGTRRKKKIQEWTLFLPFDAIYRQREPNRAACVETIKSACSVLDRIGIDAGNVRARTQELATVLVSNPVHFRDHE